MGRLINLTGMIFGKWLVLKRSEKRKKGTYWVCECQCENKTIREVISDNLTSGKSKGCGCIYAQLGREKRINLIGKIFGRLKVLKLIEDKKLNGDFVWLCECLNDGNLKEVRGGCLRRGETKSCGCLASENGKNRKKFNVYDLETQDYGIGYTLKNEIFYFSKEDYDLIKNYCWHFKGDRYLYSPDPSNRKKNIPMHRLIMNFPDLMIDHINRERNDNRKENLRLVTDLENARNNSIQKRNKTGITGVNIKNYKNKSVYVSYIGVNYKTIHLIETDNFYDAVRIRLLAEREYFGVHSPQIHLFAEYDIPPLDQE